MWTDSGGEFVALTYNILAESLGSNCIPWVMTVGDQFRVAVEDAAGCTWNDWKERNLFPEYRGHFHKNLSVADYTAMRKLWSARTLLTQEDVPSVLKTSLTVVAEDEVLYTDAKGQTRTARTLRGLLRQCFPENGFGLDLFQHLMSEEEEVYRWEVRGPRVLQEIVSARELQPLLDTEETRREVPHVVALVEYDCMEIQADYAGAGQQTFAQAMAKHGYSHLMFRDPLKDRPKPSGLGIFWNDEVFALPAEAAQIITGNGAASSSILKDLRCGESIASSVHNIDLMERWHRTSKGSSPVNVGQGDLMPDEDRRNLALLRLIHKASGKPLWVAAAHLMTTSRDSEKTNLFPGEVRAGELQVIRQSILDLVPEGEAVLLMGDFNTDAKEVQEILAGKLTSRATGHTLQLQTGLEDAGEVEEPEPCRDSDSPSPSRRRSVLSWHAAKGAASLQLQEAFESVHKWGAAVGPRGAGGFCTSLNAVRVEWIDYIWYSGQLLRPVALSDATSPAQPIPDRTHGSDHLPLAARFTFLGQSV